MTASGAKNAQQGTAGALWSLPHYVFIAEVLDK